MGGNLWYLNANMRSTTCQGGRLWGKHKEALVPGKAHLGQHLKERDMKKRQKAKYYTNSVHI